MAHLDLSKASFEDLVNRAGDVYDGIVDTTLELQVTIDPVARLRLKQKRQRLIRESTKLDRVIAARFFRRRLISNP